MTIEHIAACDGCGDRRDAIDVSPDADAEQWDTPGGWITVAGPTHDRHFCTWACAHKFIAQMTREDELASDDDTER